MSFSNTSGCCGSSFRHISFLIVRDVRRRRRAGVNHVKNHNLIARCAGRCALRIVDDRRRCPHSPLKGLRTVVVVATGRRCRRRCAAYSVYLHIVFHEKSWNDPPAAVRNTPPKGVRRRIVSCHLPVRFEATDDPPHNPPVKASVGRDGGHGHAVASGSQSTGESTASSGRPRPAVCSPYPTPSHQSKEIQLVSTAPCGGH